MADPSDYDFDRGPSPVSYTVAFATLEYIFRLVQLGMVEGQLGDQRINPEVEQLVWALHHSLAGGEIKVEIVRKGNPDIVRELEKRLADAHAASNVINKNAGYYVTIMI